MKRSLGLLLKAGLDSLLEKKENGINEMLLENGKTFLVVNGRGFQLLEPLSRIRKFYL